MQGGVMLAIKLGTWEVDTLVVADFTGPES